MFENIGEDQRFIDVKDQFSEHACRLLKVPDYVQVAENLVSMANYLPVIEKLIHLKKPRVICEVGAYKGVTTLALAELFGNSECQIDIVDPEIDSSVKRIEMECLHYYSELSIDYLARDKALDVVFLDGDHNYETVQQELNSLLTKDNEKGAPLVFLHDVGWPCGYRDLYYQPERIKKRHTVLNQCHLTFNNANEKGQGIPLNIPVSSEEGGEKNGVMRAV